MLHKALFGLRQSANLWHKKFHESIIALGWKLIKGDLCLYIRYNSDNQDNYSMLMLYVGDFIVAAPADS